MRDGWSLLRRVLVGTAAAALVVATGGLAPTTAGAAAGCATTLSAGGCAWQDTTTVLVHGWSITSATDCTDYWDSFISAETALAVKSAGHAPRFVRVGYYTKDTNCDVNLASLAGGATIDNDTDIGQIGLLLRRYLDATFPSEDVNLVAHSMGGLVVRTAMASSLDGQAARPLVNHIVTLSSPHQGVSLVLCAGAIISHQVTEMCRGSSFLRSLGTTKNQSTAGTAWSVLGSDDDLVVPASRATASSGSDAGAFQPDLRVIYADEVGYGHGDMVDGNGADATCEANAATCVNGRVDTGSGFVQVTNHTLATVHLATSRALTGVHPRV